jgi:RNA polymerase sigma factor FliA
MIQVLEIQQKVFKPPMSPAAEWDESILERLPHIKYIAQRISLKLPTHVELNDLVSAGILGLLNAIERFDPTRQIKFRTYAELRIKGAILDSLRNLDWAPRSLRKKCKDLKNAYRELDQRFGRPATDTEVCEEMGIPLNEFYELAAKVRNLNMSSFRELSRRDDDRNSQPLLDVPDASCQDPFFVFQKSEIQNILSATIDALPQKERLVITLYYFEELTMKEIGKILAVNESRVSQLHTKAIVKLRTKLREMHGQVL